MYNKKGMKIMDFKELGFSLDIVDILSKLRIIELIFI